MLYQVSIQALFRKYIWMIIIKNYLKKLFKKIIKYEKWTLFAGFFLKVLKIIIITVLELF